MKTKALRTIVLILFFQTVIQLNYVNSQSVLPGPENLTFYRGNNYSVYDFYITGTTSGTLWGCNLYTDDSKLSTAAVHAGYIGNTISKIIRVRILPGQSSYSACTQNTIASISYGSWGGSYEIFSSYDMVAPTVLTTVPTNITVNSATSGGNVSSEGSTTVTARGVCWNTSGSPTISNSKTNDGSGTGIYSSTITGLSNGTTYYLRSYATNNCGVTSYGNQQTFTTGNINIGTSYYNTLKEAFDAINNGTHTGIITLKIIGSTTEIATASLNASGTGNANYSSVIIYPTTSGLSISGNFNTPLIQFYGADNVTIDGRLNSSGSSIDLTIVNSNTGTFSSAIKYLNSAENNIVKYCTIKSSCYSNGVGAINFTSSNIGNGNDNNIVEYCNITNAGGNRPLNAIFTSGGSGRENSGNIIRNNNIYDILSPNGSSNGINISYLSTDWTISENNFYETTTIIPTAAHRYYAIMCNTGTNTITGNYIGGSEALCGGSAMTINANTTHYFCGIFINGGSSSPAVVENNTISNINYTSVEDNPWDGIFVNSGMVNVIGNTIGNTTGNGSITVTTPLASATATISGGVVTAINLNGGGSGYTTAPLITFSVSGSSIPATATANIVGGIVTSITLDSGGSGYTGAPNVVFDAQSNNYSTSHGILNASASTVNITGNNIGSITTIGSSTYSHGFESIYLRGVAGNITVNNNLVGSLSTPNSIQTSSTAQSAIQKQDVYGIYSSNLGNTIIRGNTVANLHNAYTGTNSGSRARGISTISGANTIENNTVRNISSASSQSATKSAATVIGISQTSNTAGLTQTVKGNTVYNLSSTNTTARVDIYGIYWSGPVSGTNLVTGNFIHSISFASSNVLCDMDGIVLYNGLTTCSNNIVNLGTGITTGYKINGIWDDGSATGNCNIYFNTVYIGGNVSSGTTNNTSALWCAANYSTKIYQNNLLINARSGGATGKHYAIYLAGIANLSINYNDYFASGTGGVLGKISTFEKSDLATWKTSTAQDANSLSINPGFTSAGGTIPTDYYTSTTLTGVPVTGTNIDYAGITRSEIPKMGALENNNFVWQGTISTDFGTSGNWSGGIVPSNGADISFAVNPDRSCVLDQDRTLGDITNAQATDLLIINGKQLTITGDIILSNNAKIDATAEFSKIIFAGNTTQNIPTGSFISNTIDSLTINNLSGLTLNGDFTINKGIALIAGNFAIGPNTLTFNGVVTAMTGTVTGGSSTNMIIGGSGEVINMPDFILNNLTINRANGVNLYGDLSIVGTLTLTNGTLTVGSNTLTLSSTPIRTNGYIDASNSGSTLEFVNSSAIILPDLIISGNINNLTISGIGGITSKDDIILNGILNLANSNPTATKGLLDMWDGSTMKTLTMGSEATTIGIGDVTGIVKRTNFVANTEYTFGNQFTSMTFLAGGTMPSEVSIKIAIGTSPSWKTTAVQREYDIIRTGGISTKLTLSLHYLDNELQSNTENNLIIWDYHSEIPLAEEHGKANQNTDDNWVAISNRNITYFPTNFDARKWIVSNKESANFVWQGTPSSDWNDVNNWSGGEIPTSTSDVLIPSAAITVHDPILPTSPSAIVRTIIIQDGGILDGGTGTTLTVAGSTGAWFNNGTFNAGTSTVIFTNANATMADPTNFYNVTIANGASLTPETNNVMRISGELSILGTGILRATLLPNTIEFNGSNQSIVNTNGSSPGYYNLIVSGTGNKTLPSTDLSIYGNFLIEGQATAVSNSNITVAGDISIGEEAILVTGNYGHQLKGNFENNGTFTTSLGNTITFNGTTNQVIMGTITTNFQNLKIQNNNGVSLAVNTNINAEMNLTSGVISVGEYLLGINGTILKTNGFIELSPLSSLSFGGSDAILLNDDLFNSVPIIKNLNIDRVGGVTLGNQNITINNLLTLETGTLNIGANTLTLSGSSPSRTSGNINASNAMASLVFANFDEIILPESIFNSNVNNLTISGLGGVTSTGDFTINGVLNLESPNPLATKGSLDMWDGSDFKTLTMGADATTIGIGDVTGIIKRTTINHSVKYTFGNEFTFAYFPNEGTLPSSISAKIRIGTSPTWRTGAINREVEIIQTGGSATKAIFSCHYLDSELNENNEEHLVLWVGLSPTNIEYGRSNFNSVENWVSLSNVNVGFFSNTWDALKDITLDEYSDATTLTWNGSESDSWTSPGNWTPNAGPSSDKNIIIPDASTTLRTPLLPAFTEIKSITIDAAGVLNAVDGAQLTINGKSGAWINFGGVFYPNNSNVFFKSNNATISGETNFYNLTINTDSVVWMTDGSIVRIAGSLTNNGKLRTVIDGPTIVEYNGGDQTVVVPNPSTNRYSTLILSGSGIKTMPTSDLQIVEDFLISGTASATAASSLNVDGDIIIHENAEFNASNFTHTFGGNFINQGTFNSGASTIIFDGSNSQEIKSGGDYFYNVTFNNNTSENQDINISDPMSIDNSCTFTNGIIYFTNTGAINFGSSAVSSESSSSSFVNGKIAKTGTNAFVFPIGDVSGSNAVWAPIGIAAPVSLSTISAEYSLSAGPNNWSPSAMCSGSEIIYTSGFENWVLNTTDAHPAVTLYWKTTGSGIQDPADLVVAHYNGTCWENMGGTAVGNSTSGFITSSVEFTSYSPLSFGTKTKDNTLPVELVEFTGNCYNNKIQLSWTTASEINNNYFAIERSDNTADWTEIGLVKGVGNSNQMENYNFIDLNSGNFSHYYRLRQVNFDGKFEYSDIIMVNNCDELSNEFINVFPNPSDGNITINSNSEILEIRLCDLTGKVIYRKNKIDAVSAECNFSKLKKGMYIIEISTITKTYNQRITIM